MTNRRTVKDAIQLCKNSKDMTLRTRAFLTELHDALAKSRLRILKSWKSIERSGHLISDIERCMVQGTDWPVVTNEPPSTDYADSVAYPSATQTD